MFTIWVTKACNMNCKYCYEGIEKEKEFMTKETADAVMDWIIKTSNLTKKDYFFCEISWWRTLVEFSDYQVHY